MEKQSFKIGVKPEVFKWLFSTSGYRIEDVNNKLKVPPKTVEKWVSGEDKPTLDNVKELSKIFNRSLAVFLLPKPPEELPLPKDRRSIKEFKPLTPKTYKAMRIARWTQYIAESLMTNLKLDTSPKIKIFSYKDNSETVAQQMRTIFGVKVEDQFKWKEKEAFNRWKELIEGQNIIVLQFPIPVEEVRGFALTDKEPYVIVVSSSDDPNAKIFTLFHEYAHIILKESSICNPLMEIDKTKDTFERWCDSFAGFFLLPTENIETDFKKSTDTNLLRKVSGISKNYKVSKLAILVRLRNLRLVDHPVFQKEWNMLTSPKKKTGGKSLPVPERRIQERGKKFVSLVLQNAREKYITNSDALDYLSIKTKHLKQIRSLVGEK